MLSFLVPCRHSRWLGLAADAIEQSEVTCNAFGFTGKERDGESGLDYFSARYCSAAQGRFTSIDPVAMSRDKMKDPQLLNMYAYTRNNPLRYIDPTGEEVRLSELSEEERKKLIEELQKQTGLLLRYNAKSGNLEIAGV